MLFETFTVQTATDIYELITLGYIIYLGIKFDLFLDMKRSDKREEKHLMEY